MSKLMDLPIWAVALIFGAISFVVIFVVIFSTKYAYMKFRERKEERSGSAQDNNNENNIAPFADEDGNNDNNINYDDPFADDDVHGLQALDDMITMTDIDLANQNQNTT